MSVVVLLSSLIAEAPEEGAIRNAVQLVIHPIDPIQIVTNVALQKSSRLYLPDWKILRSLHLYYSLAETKTALVDGWMAVLKGKQNSSGDKDKIPASLDLFLLACAPLALTSARSFTGTAPRNRRSLTL